MSVFHIVIPVTARTRRAMVRLTSLPDFNIGIDLYGPRADEDMIEALREIIMATIQACDEGQNGGRN